MDDASLDILDTLDDGFEPEPEPLVEVDTQPVVEPDPEPLANQKEFATDEILGAIDAAKSDVLSSMPSGTSESATTLDTSDVQVLEGGTYTVVIDSEQWDELRDCWHYAKEYGSIATVSIVLQLGILAALLGARMYSIFSDGWRSHA